ncbi:MAG: DUF4363 family protein [Oscillospiraceae bacterium]
MKRAFWLPVSLLAVMLSASLLSGFFIGRDCDRWSAALEEAAVSASAGDWESAERQLEAVSAAWDARQTYLHIVEVHEALNQTEALLRRVQSFARQRDAAEFHASVQELLSALRVLAEMESVNIKNIL